MNALEFADEHLFSFPGLSNRCWYDDDHGNTIGGIGLMLRPCDMAKIGILFLNRGQAPDRCVSENWIDVSTGPQISLNHFFDSLDHNVYGFLWWVGEQNELQYYSAWGRYGQFVFCIPDLNLVAVTSSELAFGRFVIDQQEADNLDLITNSLLPCVQKL